MAADNFEGARRRPGPQGAGERSQAGGSPGTAGAPGARRQRQRQGRRGGQEGAGDRRQLGSRPRPFWPPSTGWPTRRKPPGIRTTPAATKPPATSSSSTAATRKASQYYRKAIELDPQLYSARSQLGINLMRLGQNEEAYKQLETCLQQRLPGRGHQELAEADGQLQELRHLQDSDHHPQAATRRKRTCCARTSKRRCSAPSPPTRRNTRSSSSSPVQVEVYPDHEDFAVRTLGMPGLGALGVTFGYAIAMDSPSGRKPGSFHWASTLWHEMSHVFTLTMTNHRVPRWFTEGLAVHEETAASPEWGDRLGPDEIAAIKNKKLLPVAELDRGFVHPGDAGAGGGQLFPGRQDLRLHQREVGLGHAARHAARFRRRRGHRRGDPQRTEDRAGGVRQAVSGLRSKPRPRTTSTTSTNGRRG